MKKHDDFFMFILICIIFLFSTFGSNVLSISTPIGEMYVLRIAILLLCIAFILIKLNKKNKTKGLSGKYSVFWLFLLLYSLIQLLWVKDFIFPSVLNTKKRFVICLYLLEVSIVVQMIIGGYEAFTGNYMVQTKYVETYIRLQGLSSTGFYTPVAMMYNPNDFATTLIVGACVAVILFNQSKNVFVKFAHLIVFFACAPLIYFADSRACLIAYGLLIVLYVFFFIKKRFVKRLFVIFLIAAGFYIIPRLTQFFFDTSMAESDNVRLSLIFDGFYILISTLFMGVGFGQVGWWYSNKHHFSQGVVLIPHNWWIEAMMTFGLLFFVLYLWLYFGELKSLVIFSKKTHNNKEQTMCKGFTIFLIVFIMLSISSSSLFKAEYIWAFFALINSFVGYASKLNNKRKTFAPVLPGRVNETLCTDM